MLKITQLRKAELGIQGKAWSYSPLPPPLLLPNA